MSQTRKKRLNWNRQSIYLKNKGQGRNLRQKNKENSNGKRNFAI